MLLSIKSKQPVFIYKPFKEYSFVEYISTKYKLLKQFEVKVKQKTNI